MNPVVLILTALTFSQNVFAQNIVTATKTQDDLDLCYLQQLPLKGYAYANLVGRCAWDPAMNGMQLTLVAMPEDPTADGQKIELDYVRNVVRAQSKGSVIQFSVVQDTMDAEGKVSQLGRTITVRSLNPKKGSFQISPKR
jgi:hypothetical protein